MDAYIANFQRLNVMISRITERRLVVLFSEGLMEPLKGWIKAIDPPTLHEAMKKARSMEQTAPRSKNQSKPFSHKEDKKHFSKDSNQQKNQSRGLMVRP